MESEYTLQEKYIKIREAVLGNPSANAVEIAMAVMREEYVNMHGPEHHFLDGAAFLAAYKNAGGEIGLESALEELAKRTIDMPGAMCGYWGICGSVAAVGAALSVIHRTGPLSTDRYYKEHMEYTASAIAVIAKPGGARCCKRNAFLSLTVGAEFVRKTYGIAMQTAAIGCPFSERNKQCLQERCPFHRRPEKDL